VLDSARNEHVRGDGVGRVGRKRALVRSREACDDMVPLPRYSTVAAFPAGPVARGTHCGDRGPHAKGRRGNREFDEDGVGYYAPSAAVVEW